MEETSGSTGTTSTIGGAAAPELVSAGDRVRSLVAETEVRGAPMISAQALQRWLFEVYDAASAVPEALALVQQNLGLTLDRTWYSAAEIDGMAGQIDWLLANGPVAVGDLLELEAEGGEVTAGPGSVEGQ